MRIETVFKSLEIKFICAEFHSLMTHYMWNAGKLLALNSWLLKWNKINGAKNVEVWVPLLKFLLNN